MKQALHTRTFKEYLNKSLLGCQQLKTVLLDEQHAYYKRDFEQINLATLRKQTLLQQVSRENEELLTYFHSSSAGTNTSLSAYIKAHVDNKELLPEWNNLINMLEECRQLNQQNRALITAGLSYSYQSLRFLQQFFTDETIQHYNKSGLSHDMFPNRMNLEA